MVFLLVCGLPVCWFVCLPVCGVFLVYRACSHVCLIDCVFACLDVRAVLLLLSLLARVFASLYPKGM